MEFTATMEDRLDSIEEGAIDWKKILSDFYGPFQQELEIADKEIGQLEVADEVTDELCENCGRNLVIKSGRFGKFLACPGFPECRFTKPILKDIGINCPQCGEGKIVVRLSKKRKKFYGCSRFPQCSFVSWAEPVAEKCPRCGAFLVKKRYGKSAARLVCSDEKCTFKKNRK